MEPAWGRRRRTKGEAGKADLAVAHGAAAAGGCWPENGLDGGRPFFSPLRFFLLICSHLFLFFSLFLLLPASACCFSFLLLFLMVVVVVGGAMVVLFCGGGQCLLLFFCLCRGVSSFFFKGVAAGGGRWLEVDDGAASGCWPVELLWRWRGRNSGGAQGVRNGSSSSLCRDRSLCFSLPTFVFAFSPLYLKQIFLFLFQFVHSSLSVLLLFLFFLLFGFSLLCFQMFPSFLFSKPSVPPPFSVLPPPHQFVPPSSIYKQEEMDPLLCPIVVQGGPGLPYLCRVRWPAIYMAGCPFLGRVWLCGYEFWQGFMQVGGRESEREKDFQKSSSSLPLHTQGRRRTVPFKTTLFRCSFFF